MSKDIALVTNTTDAYGAVYQSFGLRDLSADSPRVNGKLRLNPQPYTFLKHQVTSYVRPSAAAMASSGVALRPDLRPTYSTTALTNKALARFNKRLSDGKASLGITIAQWRSSRDMIVDRADKLSRYFDGRYRSLRRRGRKFQAKDPASAYLEGQFGWIPLVEDIVAASTTAFSQAIPPLHVSGRASETFDETVRIGNLSTGRTTIRYVGKRKCSVDAFVRITNPNLWLANRMGLVNPAVVTWDAIPWSWVIGMFANINQLLTQFTDELGVAVDKRSVTYTIEYLEFQTLEQTGRPTTRVTVYRRQKVRTVGNIPAASLQFRMPTLSWGLVGIATSLVTQKVRKLAKLNIF
jgi:hypothetical protein